MLLNVCVADEPEISIKGEREVVCGNAARFLVDINPEEQSSGLVTWQKVRGMITEQIDISIEKYLGSSNRQFVINSVCKEDGGEYQAVLSQQSNGKNKKTFSNSIFLLPKGGNIYSQDKKKIIGQEKRKKY